jgi:glycerophosphoryl diester phosphodiesterase
MKNTIPPVRAQHPAREIFGGHERAIPVVVAHRGASRRHPENTIAAFAAAGALGADGVELDVHRCVDDALVVHHDAHLPDGRAIDALAAAELPDHVPSLSAAFRACAPLGVNVEIKPDDPSLADVLADSAERSRTLVSSFHFAVAARAASLGLASSFLTNRATIDDVLIARCLDAGLVGLHPDAGSVDERAVARCHDHGLFVMAWTVDEPAEITRLASAGIDAICTNVPDAARQVLRRQATSIDPTG